MSEGTHSAMYPQRLRRRPATACTLALAAFATALALTIFPAGAQAAAPPQFWQKCPSGSAAGECNIPRGIAADPATGHLYVADQGNARVNEFTVWGEFVRIWGWDVVASGPGETPADEFEVCVSADGDVCKAGVSGSAAGQFAKSNQGIALDSAGNVYVVDLLNLRVQKFSPDGGFLLMFGGDVNQGGGTPTNPGNVCTAAHHANGDVCGAGSQGGAPGQFGWPVLPGSYIAIDSFDRVWVGDLNRIQRFDISGTYQGEITLPGETVKSLATAPAGDLYAAYNGRDDVSKLSPTGVPLCTLDVEVPSAIATDAAGGVHVYSARHGSSPSTPQKIVQFDSACGEVNSFDAAQEGLADQVTGLTTNSACGVAGTNLYVSNSTSNPSFIRAYGPAPADGDLCPPPPVAPTISEQFAAAVGVEEATLGAQVNPHFWPDTTYYLQYGDQGPCSVNPCASEPLPPGIQLTDQTTDAELPAEVSLAGLSPDTTYHYRFVASSDGGGPVFGADEAFTTFPPAPQPKVDCPNQEFRAGPGAFLPDCRAFEMVSPLDKNNSDIATDEVQFVYDALNLSLASSDGNRATYSAFGAFGDPKAAPLHSQFLSSRDEQAGWSAHSISPPRTSLPFFAALAHANATQFKAFSEDLCSGWFMQDTDLALVPDAPPGVPSIYRRDDGDCGTQGYGLITSVAPPGYSYADVGDSDYAPRVQGVSADSSRTLLRAPAVLSADACTSTPGTEAGKGINQLYLHTAGAGNGELRLVSVLPSGDAACVHSSGGTGQGQAGASREDSVHHALSEDASRVFWSTSANAAYNQTPFAGEHSVPGPLYLRENPEGPQSPAGNCAGAAPGEACTTLISPAPDTRFWGADPAAAAALYTTGTGNENSGVGTLFRYDVGAEESTEIAAGVKGVMGASTDLSRVYFVSTQALTGSQQNSEGDAAIEGQPNLYLHESGAGHTFVARLSSLDTQNTATHFVVSSPIATLPDRRTSRISPDGLHAAFTSFAPLSGYDNTDAVSGGPSTEVFLYDAAAGAAGELACVSCNRSGARPRGRDIRGQRVAARIPGWEYQLHPTRALSANGDRLFFESFDPLVLRDTNGKRDVYEWQGAASEQECLEEVGADLYLPDSDGCLALISSGQGSVDSDFFDASASGSDVFFATTDDLVSQDPGLMDVYDARIGGGFPPPPAAPVPCQGDGCQGNPSAAPIGPGAGTAVFDGPPNQGRDWSPKPCPRGKRRVVRKGRARCVKPKRGKRAQRNRGGSR